MTANRNIIIRQGDTFNHNIVLWNGVDSGGVRIPYPANSLQEAFTDNFNREDSATSLGSPWTARSGVWGITSNKAYLTASATLPVATIEAYSSDHEVSAILSGDNNTQGLTVRYLDENNFYRLILSKTFATIILSKCVDGNLTNVSNIGLSLNIDVRVTFKAEGDVVTISSQAAGGGAVVSNSFNITDASLRTGTKCGISGGTGETSQTWDDVVIKSKPVFSSEIRRSGDTPLSPSGDDILASFSTSSNDNIVALTLSSTDSGLLPPGKHLYDIQGILPGGKIKTFLYGIVMVVPEVS
jgi:hypothetical protein